MKKSCYALVMFVALAACNNEDPQPVSQFAGSYSLKVDEVPIEIGFTVSEDGMIHNFGNNSYVRHPSIPVGEQTANNITPMHRFEDGDGYGKIVIAGRSYYYAVTLIYNRFTDEGMLVYDVQIEMSGEPFIILQDQIFTKTP